MSAETQDQTYSRDEIRRALASAMDPLTGREVCDVLGCSGRKERDGVYKALSLMAGHKAGVEQIDDGRYTLIPGWTRDGALAQSGKAASQTMRGRRGAPKPNPVAEWGAAIRELHGTAADETVADVPHEPARLALADQAEAAGATESAAQLRAIVPPPAEVEDAMRERAREMAEAPELPRTLAPALATPRPHASRGLQEHLRANRADEVAVPRRVIRALVAAVLTHGGSLSEIERHAVIEATRIAA